MRKIYLFILFFSIECTLVCQTGKLNIKKDNSEILEKILYSRKYDLVGDFFVVQKKPLIKYAKVFKQYKGWGYIDILGNEVIETKYQFLTDFYQGICKARYFARRKDPRTGAFYDASFEALMNIDGNIITKNDYDKISFFINYASQNMYNNPYRQIVVEKRNKKGLISKDGWEILPPIFDDIRDLKKSIAVKDGKKWALAKLDGSKLTDYIYDGFKIHKNFIFSIENEGLYLINPETGIHLNEEKFDNNYNLSDFDNNQDQGNDMDVLIMRKGEKSVLLNKNGKSIIEAKGLGKSSDEYYTIRNGTQFLGLINSKGKLVLDSIYVYAGVTRKDDIKTNFFGTLPDKSTVYFDNNLKKIKFPAQSEELGIDRRRFWKNGKLGIMTEKGKIIFPASLYDIRPFENYAFTVGLILVEKQIKNGLISRNGKIVLPFVYDEIYYYGNQSNEIKKDGKQGLINYKGQIIVPIIYDKIDKINNPEDFVKTLFIATDKKETKLIDLQNKTVIPNVQGGFSEVKQTFRNQRIVYSFSNTTEKESDDKGPFGLKSKDGNIIFVPQFDEISDFQNGFACAKSLNYNDYHDRRYLIDTYGNKVYLEYIDDKYRTIEEQTCTRLEQNPYSWDSF